MTTITKSQLKARMLAVFREIEETGEALIVTDHGRPVLKVVPLAPTPAGIDAVFADARERLAERGVAYSAEQLTEPLDAEGALADADWWGGDPSASPPTDTPA